MRFTDLPPRRAPWQRLLALSTLALVACTPTRPPVTMPIPPEAPTAQTPAPLTPTPTPERGATPVHPLPAPRRARDWDDLRLLAAARLIAANPDTTYEGPVVEPLLAIPVLEIELNADGSVRRVTVLREPRQAKDTIQLAIAAVHRAAPFGPVAHLPRPWKFAEVFLFNEERRFKPRSLDL